MGISLAGVLQRENQFFDFGADASAESARLVVRRTVRWKTRIR
jgi:hypothetical protein